MKTIFAAAVIVALFLPAQGRAQESAHDTASHAPSAREVKVTQVYAHPLHGVPGKSLKGVLVEYPPGGSSPPHTHAKSAMIYATVLEGAVRCQLNDEPVRTYRAGENWTEMPGDRHRISANASDTLPAKVLAVFVVDDADTVLTIPDRK